MLLGLALSLVVVAGAPPGPTLAVQDTRDGKLDLMALTLTAPGLDAVKDERASRPVWPDDASLLAVASGDQVFFGGVVDASAAGVEIEFEGGAVVRVPTVAGEAYSGRDAGRVRFFAGEVTSQDASDEARSIRMLDAAGAVVGVAKSPDTERRAEIARRGSLRFDAVVTSRLDPVALAPEHRSEELCLFVRGRRADGEPLACRDERAPTTLGGYVGCGRSPSTLTGFVPDGTRRLDLRLGSGRTARLTPRAAPLDQGGLIVAGVLPSGEAIRDATARDAAGRVLKRAAVRVAPPFRRCGKELRRWSYEGNPPAPRLGRPPGTQLAAELAANGGPQLLARDEDDRLCVGLDRLDLGGGDCSAPRFSAFSGSALTVDPEQGVAFGAFPARVAEVEVHFSDGQRIRSHAVGGLEYTGRYRDAVHFALIPLLVGKTATIASLLDAAGRDIGSAYVDVPGDGRPAGPPRTLLRDGPVRLIARGGACIGLAGRACDEYHEPEGEISTRVVATCGRRRTIVFGLVPRSYKRVEVAVKDGRPVRAQLTRLPRGQGRAANVYVAVLGPGAEVTGVTVGGPLPYEFTVPARPASRQCGWDWGDRA